MKKNKNLFIFSVLFLAFSILLFRDYLYTYRMMLTNFVPYDFYQNQLIYFNTLDDNFKLTIPSALRIVPIFFYYILFLFAPCLKLTKINEDLTEDYVCATNAVAMGNYILMIMIIVLFYFYQKKILKNSQEECYLGLFLCYAVMKYLDHFTIDRFVVFYLLLVLITINNLKYSIILIILSFLVSEKVFFITGILFFIKLFFQNDKKKYLMLLLASCVSLIMYFILIKIGRNYFEFFAFEFDIFQLLRMFYNKSAISGSLVPLLIALSPYLFWTKNSEKIFCNQRVEFLLPISLLLFGVLGGVENSARYITHSFPVWLPILISRINEAIILNKTK